MPKFTVQTSPATDEQVLEIRIKQNKGIRKCDVRAQYPTLSPKTFDNVWSGITKAGVFPK